MTTTETNEQASFLVDNVLNKRLAACIQTNEIESHYVWEGKICHDKEILIRFKTEKRLFKELEELLTQIHPYDTPEIICTPICEASKKYEDWMSEVLK